ncbi:site-specific DNA-methyltransferase [Mesorhizobium sp. CA8]|uniref:DNA-methyltransferase n=1 Tax=Mesorhizobium sp. CA8 TaxID=2876637 RepID=UPI001CCCCB90|nr:site-specific DNA-methyltransferase [Mesorhizobium sp. CA8]MBZ9759462.1 site-specific DNA-methyltransferase [Mesorhizobium sp. CA8]
MSIRIITGDCRDVLAGLPAGSVDCCVTSPPYFGLRDYGVDGQIGLEETPDAFVAEMVAVFRDVRRVLRDDGTLWLNLGDSYANDGKWGGSSGGKHVTALHGNTGVGRAKKSTGLKPKDLTGIPWRVAFALQADGWYLRQDIIWSKPNPMPESVQDRCTKAHEYIFLLSKSQRYHFDAASIAEESLTDDPRRPYGSPGANALDPRGRQGNGERRRGVPPRHADYESSDQSGLNQVGRGMGRNKRSVWTVATQPFKEAHFATFPPELIEPCIKAGCPAGGTVLDPFGGAGTTGLVADRLQRNAILIELNPAYAEMARKRLSTDAGMFAEVA